MRHVVVKFLVDLRLVVLRPVDTGLLEVVSCCIIQWFNWLIERDAKTVPAHLGRVQNSDV